jgi:hypothetical protein
LRNKSPTRNIYPATFAVLCILGGAANADDFSAYTKALNVLGEPAPRPSVGLVASGFGASAGQMFVGVSYTDRDEQTDGSDNDGSIVIGRGFGDPSTALGTELTIGITSVSTSLWGDGKFADEGNLNIKLYREISLPMPFGRSSVAFGVSNLAGWGATTDNPKNVYAVLTASQALGEFSEYGALYTIGYGTGVSDAETGSDFFGGIGIGRGDYSASLSFIGGDLHLTGNWYPSFYENAVISYSRSDFTNNSGLERNIISFGLSF